ncbi:hypothetical protein DDV21_002695 [Streptococcus chenjunshii]|uniref:Uncharacterized protein n=1 Tax=Streptococcus chenjunshii TaxID=2173853 RepID=A0A346NAL1_9STRE|nr:hypothetical protein DDV21_002695 [Streptococcus chenjunshii]
MRSFKSVPSISKNTALTTKFIFTLSFTKIQRPLKAHSKNRKTDEESPDSRKVYLFCKELRPCSIPLRYKGREKLTAKIGKLTKSRQTLGRFIFFAKSLGRVQFH